MNVREARIDDVKQIQIVRNSVKENKLSTPNFITDEDYVTFITIRGKGWVCEIDNQIVGFAIADLIKKNIWALFLKPEFEKRGIGKLLLKIMVDWFFSRTRETVWVGTALNTRAELFYRKLGWKKSGTNGTTEIKFELTYEDWRKLNKNAMH